MENLHVSSTGESKRQIFTNADFEGRFADPGSMVVEAVKQRIAAVTRACPGQKTDVETVPGTGYVVVQYVGHSHPMTEDELSRTSLFLGRTQEEVENTLNEIKSVNDLERMRGGSDNVVEFNSASFYYVGCDRKQVLIVSPDEFPQGFILNAPEAWGDHSSFEARPDNLQTFTTQEGETLTGWALVGTQDGCFLDENFAKYNTVIRRVNTASVEGDPGAVNNVVAHGYRPGQSLS